MAPLPIITNVIRCAVEGHLSNGKNWANVMHFRKATATSFVAAITTLDPLVVALYDSTFTGGFNLKGTWRTSQGIDQIVYTPLDGTSASTIIAHSIAGLETNDALPQQTSQVVTWYTALRGRRHRGRTFLPPECEGDNGANGTPGSPAGLQTQYNQWLASFGATGLNPVVASYKFASAEDVTRFLVRGIWATQRRRELRS